MVRKKYLVCVDSDGCAMDTMNSKHEKCFGPAVAEIWNLEERRDEVQKCWERVNLFSETRGINRFLALCIVLEEVGCTEGMEGFMELKQWTQETNELSAASLKRWMESKPSDCCYRAYEWSCLVNKKISQMPKDGNTAFSGVRNVLARIHKDADIAVVSSANRSAVEEEWERESLLPYVDVLMTQENGSKQACIKQMLESGYEAANILMVGDAPGDLEAARNNGVYFYPILAEAEEESWEQLENSAFKPLICGNYDESIWEKNFCGNLRKLSER